MYTCKGCGGYLRFDIDSQSLKCDSCSNIYPVPEESHQSMDAEYTAKIYSCPNCGGELIGDDNEAVVFCSFCGSSNVLQERYTQERRPAKIIPFKINKAKCKEIYANKLKSAAFAPREFKDPNFIDSFRGIYMPFYRYDVSVNDRVNLYGESVDHGLTKDVITEYVFTGQVKGKFGGLSHDASSSFADDISESISPYRDEDSRAFEEGYMAGFYADTADVDEKIYREDVKNIAKSATTRQVEIRPELSPIKVKGSAYSQLHPEIDDTNIGLYPVWFLSYRNKDRVAYAAINGQTGKIAMDIPVDMRKYFAITLGFAIPIFVILNFFLTLRPVILLGAACVFTVVAAVIAMTAQKNLTAAISGARDKGLGKTDQKNRTVKPFVVILGIALIIGIGVIILNPVSDLIYYIASLLCIVAVALTMISLVRVYNVITTRPLPQFKRRGGDDRA